VPIKLGNQSDADKNSSLQQLFKARKERDIRGTDFENNQRAINFDHEIFKKYHDEQSKIKNINLIYYGPFKINPWYWSPYPVPRDSDL
jgi:hypothetical protein